MFKKVAIAYLGKKYCKKNTLEKNQMPNCYTKHGQFFISSDFFIA